MSKVRDLEPASDPIEAPGRVAPAHPAGRKVIAVIGIDRYQHDSWRPLSNAVADARGAAALFHELGFEQVAALYGDEATSEAIEGLVTDDLTRLGPQDSLVLFYAGHGSTRLHQLGDQVVKTGYLIPFDASDRTATWIELDAWLRAVALLPAKHILVILDACHSGIALGAVMKWRDGGPAQPLPMSALRARRSRRIITSALDNEQALDSGPHLGHSLFTGCLIEVLTHGDGRPGSHAITGSELGVFLQQRVESYPKARQTPDFGTFDFDERGEMVIPFLRALTDPGGDQGGGKGQPRKVIIDPQQDRPPRRVVLAAAAGTAVALALALLGYKMLAPTQAPASIDAALERPAVPPAPPDHAPAPTDGTQATSPSGGCPLGMVPIPSGTFQMGSPDGEGEDSEHPQHAVTLDGYCIDKTEVTVREYEACVAADRCSATPRSIYVQLQPSQPAVSMRCNLADQPEHPINCVSWDQAAEYCTWAQKQVPTEAEWEYAARGSDGRRYPWGTQPPSAHRLNACGRECVEMAKRDLRLAWDGMYDDRDGWPMTAPVGSYPAGASPFGVLDMAGNVAEWTADSFKEYTAAATTNPQNPVRSLDLVFRGGGWDISAASGVRAAFRTRTSPSHGYLGVGFRCVRRD
jgi:formylglycine-generating enzyme required for sulfatase activity